MAYWQVTAQTPNQIQVTSAGQVVNGTEVYFSTGDGNTGSVFVPDDHYNEKTVRDMVQARADIIDAVGGLANTAE